MTTNRPDLLAVVVFHGREDPQRHVLQRIFILLRQNSSLRAAAMTHLTAVTAKRGLETDQDV